MNRIQDIIAKHRRVLGVEIQPYFPGKIASRAPAPIGAVQRLEGQKDSPSVRKLRTIMRNLGRERNCPVLYAAPYGKEFRRVICVPHGDRKRYQVEAWSPVHGIWLVRERSTKSLGAKLVDSLFTPETPQDRKQFLAKWAVLLEFRNCMHNADVLEDFVRFLPDEDTLLDLYYDARRYNFRSALLSHAIRAARLWVEGPKASKEPLCDIAIALFQERFGFKRNFESVPKTDYRQTLPDKFVVTQAAL